MHKILIALLTLSHAAAVIAFEFTVTSTVDSAGATANDGTLRGAVLAANATVNGNGQPDEINFALPANSTITLTAGQLVILNSLRIRGPGAAVLSISGGGVSRILLNDSQQTKLEVSGLTMTQGHAPNGVHGLAMFDPLGQGGNGGAICSYGPLTLINCVFSLNQSGHGGNGHAAWVDSSSLNEAGEGAPGGEGGAIWAYLGLAMNGCSFSGNITGRGGLGGDGGIYPGTTSGSGGRKGGDGGVGGAVSGLHATEVKNCIFINNHTGAGGNGGQSGGPGGAGGSGGHGGSGGAMHLVAATGLVVESCTAENNYTGDGGAGVNGGAPYNSPSDGSETIGHPGSGGAGGSGGAFLLSGYSNLAPLSLQLSRCTVSNNYTGNGGSAGAWSNTPTTVVTFGSSGSGGPGGSGGGIHVSSVFTSSLHRLQFENNHCGNGSGSSRGKSDLNLSSRSVGVRGGFGGSGGALYLAGITVLSDSEFVSNHSGNGATGGAGGAAPGSGVAAGAGGLGGDAGKGGAIAADSNSSRVAISRCSFSLCHTGTGGMGGAGGATAGVGASGTGGRGGVGGAGGAVSLGRTYCSFATSTISQCSTGAGGTGGSGGASSGNGGVGGAGGEGGGLAIVLGKGSNNQFTTVTSATITHCTTGAGAAGGSPGVGGGTVGAAGIMGSGGCLYSATTGSGFSNFSNCIIADDGGGSLVADLGGFLASNGFNLIGNGTGASFTPLPTDLVGSTSSPLLALLGPLGNHGGPTSTCLILPGSLALDSGNPSQLEPDQRGLSRPRGAGVDRGAVEMGTPTPVELWRHSLAQSYASTDTVADEADFDGDGVPNLIELACGTDPQTPATGLRALTYEGDLSGGGLIISRGIPITIAN